MNGRPLDIDILCKVVDNYGDIGFAYRLARALSDLDPAPRLRLVVDDLSAFVSLDPAIDPTAAFQEVHGWTIVRWDSPSESFISRRPRILIECFACGRPDWLENIVFDPNNKAECLIVDLEHLTAEKYAEDLHLMPSLTRSSQVKKIIFLPGFTARTGGLVMDGSFVRARRAAADGTSRDRPKSATSREALRLSIAARSPAPFPGDAGERFWVTIFSYERNYGPVIEDLRAFDAKRPLLALVAAGKSQSCFLEAWARAGRPFPAVALPFLPQEVWDEVILASDFSIVRGEDSWARAALSGRPFLWQAYPQEGRQQMVKVEAFLDA